MKIKRRTKIIQQTERKFSFAIEKRPIYFFCPRCAAAREMLSINEAAKRSGAQWREIVRRIETNMIHTTETADGAIYICAESLGAN